MEKTTFLFICWLLLWPHAIISVMSVLFAAMTLGGVVKLEGTGYQKTMGKVGTIFWVFLMGTCTGATALVLYLVPKFICQ